MAEDGSIKVNKYSKLTTDSERKAFGQKIGHIQMTDKLPTPEEIAATVEKDLVNKRQATAQEIDSDLDIDNTDK